MIRDGLRRTAAALRVPWRRRQALPGILSVSRHASASARVARIAPPLSARTERLRRVLTLYAAASGIAYLTWRGLATLEPDSMAFGLTLLGVETLLYLNAAIFWWSAWSEVRSAPFVLVPDLTVDVFITTYNEAPDLVRATALGALAMDYPHRTFILDDGRRDVVRLIAEEIGCGYITRTDNKGAKAGNINHALSRTDGEFVAVFDADHVPQRAFLTETLGYFVDPKMAMVQTPQDYYNLSSIQHGLDRGQRAGNHWHEQRIFFDVVMPAKNRTNSAFWCGSCAILRRAAIDSVGGMATECVIEDMLTCQKMHAAGWRTHYLPATLAYGLAPDDAAQFYTQRLRWAQGAMQILRSPSSPLRMPGLSAAQRLSYFSSIATYFDAHLRLLLLLLPIYVLFSGQPPFYADPQSYLVFAVPYVVSSMTLSVITHRGVRNLLRQERFTIARMLVSIRASLTLVTGSRRLGFAVTPKTATGGGSPDAGALTGLVVLSVAAGCSGVAGLLGYGPAAGLDPWLAGGSCFWLLLNGALLASAIPMLRGGRPLQRKMYRFPWRVPLAYRNERTGETFIGGTVDVNWEGLSITGTAEVGDALSLVVRPPGSSPIHLMGEVRSAGISERRLGVLLTASDRRELDRMVLSAMLSAPHQQDPESAARWAAIERSVLAG